MEQLTPGSHAHKTIFTLERRSYTHEFEYGFYTYSFWFDGNSKITRAGGSMTAPVANAFSLIQVQDCPYATEACKGSCYVHNLEKARPDIHRKFRSNSASIRYVLHDKVAVEVAAVFAGYINEHCRASGFRWHVSGDIFSMDYAEFIRKVVLMTPEIEHWIYTRSFPYVAPLAGLPNLVLNLSADKDNFYAASLAHQAYPRTRICYMSLDGEVPYLPEGSVIFPDYALRARLPEGAAPVSFEHKLELMEGASAFWQGLDPDHRKMICGPDFFGLSDSQRCGPCHKCLVQPN